jgi:hypothetical protein
VRRRLDDGQPGEFVVAGQIGLIVFVAIAVGLHPGFVLKLNEGGVSNYGVHIKTALPYTAAFVSASATALFAAAISLHTSEIERRMRTSLFVYGALALLAGLSTFFYKLDGPLKDLHIALGVVLSIVELGAGLWYAALLRTWIDWCAFAVLVSGFVLSALTFSGLITALFAGQAAMLVGFAPLVGRASYRFLERAPDDRSARPAVAG